MIELDPPKGSEPGYRHPCVVIQNDTFNKSDIKTTVICIITSNLKLANMPGNVSIKRGEGGLQKDSVANISQISTVNKFDLEKEHFVGELPLTKVEKIVEGLNFLVKPVVLDEKATNWLSQEKCGLCR